MMMSLILQNRGDLHSRRQGSWTDTGAHPPPTAEGAWRGCSETGSLPDSTSSRQKPERGCPRLLVPGWVPGWREVHTVGSQCLRGCLTTKTSDCGEDGLQHVRTRCPARQTASCCPVTAGVRRGRSMRCGPGPDSTGVERVPRHPAARRTRARPLGAAASRVLASAPSPIQVGACVSPPEHCARQQIVAPQGATTAVGEKRFANKIREVKRAASEG